MLDVQSRHMLTGLGSFPFIFTYIHNNGEERPKLASVFVQLFICPYV